MRDFKIQIDETVEVFLEKSLFKYGDFSHAAGTLAHLLTSSMPNMSAVQQKNIKAVLDKFIIGEIEVL